MHIKDSIKSVSWRKAKRMPWRLESAQSVVLDGNVYVGSGKTVIVYHTEQDEWHQLPNPPQKDFSMAVLNDKLVLVGGMDIHGIFVQRILDKLTVWDQANGNWTHPFPNMPAARYNVSSAGYKGYLILAGGRERLPEDSNLVTSQVEVPSLSVVEILDTSNSQWYRGDPLPFECHAMQSSVIGDTLYMVGGRNRFDYFKAVVWTHLPDLIAKTSRSSCESGGASNKSYCWSMLPPCPYFASSLPFYSCVNILNTIGNAEDTTYSNGGTNRAPLLALGGLSGLQLLMFGELDTTGIVKDVNAYNPRTNRWNKVGELPEACVGCSCSLLPSGELFVAGGGQFKSSLNSVYCGKFEYNV